MTLTTIEAPAGVTGEVPVLTRIELARVALLTEQERHINIGANAPSIEDFAKSHPRTDLEVTMAALRSVYSSGR